jgi:hypothetical protein
MAVIELSVKAPLKLDNAHAIKKIDNELIASGKVRVCFYCSMEPEFLPIQQDNGSWVLRVIGASQSHMEWLVATLATYNFRIIRPKDQETRAILEQCGLCFKSGKKRRRN